MEKNAKVLSESEFHELAKNLGIESPETKSIPVLWLELHRKITDENDRRLQFLGLPPVEGGDIEKMRQLGETIGVNADFSDYDELLNFAIEARKEQIIRNIPAPNVANEGRSEPETKRVLAETSSQWVTVSEIIKLFKARDGQTLSLSSVRRWIRAAGLFPKPSESPNQYKWEDVRRLMELRRCVLDVEKAMKLKLVADQSEPG